MANHFKINLEWGLEGVKKWRSQSDVLIIIDVLSFSTSVTIAADRGAWLFPYRWKNEGAKQYADQQQAQLAGHRSEEGYSLSPASLLSIEAGTRLVLPSPNGSTISLASEGCPTLAGCLRNARAVAQLATEIGERITLIPAGEGWPSGGLRPAFEDLMGAGAIISYLPGGSSLSPEAAAAKAAFIEAKTDLPERLAQCPSGIELIERGFPEDVKLASELNVTASVAQLKEGIYRL